MNNKRAVSLALSMAILANSTGSLSVSAENDTVKYEYDGYTVYYSVVSSWDNNQNVNIQIRNNGDKAIENWAVEYTSGGEIGSIWNGTVYEHDENRYVIKNSGYNHSIAPGRTVDFGYTIQGEDLSVPESIKICTENVEITDDCNIYYNVVNDYGTRYQAEIVISNITEEPIESWELSASVSCDIDNLWNGRLYEKTENSIVVVNDENTYNISPGKSIAINVQGTKTSEDEVVFGDFSLKTNKVIPSGINNSPVSEEGTYIPHLPESSDMFIACAEYEDGRIFFEWTYTDNNGIYSIYEIKDDNRVKIDEISGKTTYEYISGEITDARYFIIERTYEGITVSSNPITVYADEEGYVITEYPDSDGDGVYDIYEHIYGTDITKPDTDDDELSDYEELYMFGTDPLDPDSDDDRLPDGYEVHSTGTEPLETDSRNEGRTDDLYDLDDDLLTNYEEYVLGTDPLSEDSDNDILNDREEVYTHKTNPNEYDTDSDHVSDSDEISLGLDPNNPETNGYPDAEYTVPQEIGNDSDIFSEINNAADNPFRISVEMDCAGVIGNNLGARESGYTAAISNESIVGIVPEITYPEALSIESFKIKFDLDSAAVINNNECHNEKDTEFDGIERFEVFKMFEDYNMLLPVKTYYDTTKNEVYTVTDTAGTYCLVDLEIWTDMLKGYGAFNDSSDTRSNVIFWIDKRSINDSTENYYELVNRLVELKDEMNEDENNGFEASVKYGTFTSAVNYTELLTSEKYKREGFDNTYLFILGDAKNTIYRRTMAAGESDLIEELKENNIKVSIISNPEKVNTYDYGYRLVKETGGIFINYGLSEKSGENLDILSNISAHNSWHFFNKKNRTITHIISITNKTAKAKKIEKPEKTVDDIVDYLKYSHSSNTIVIIPSGYKKLALKEDLSVDLITRYYNFKNDYCLIKYNKDGEEEYTVDRIDKTKPTSSEPEYCDTDNDGLYDFEEIMLYWDYPSDKLTIDEKENNTIRVEDGKLSLPNLNLVVNNLNKKGFIYFSTEDLKKKLTDNKINIEKVLILPIRSDPMAEDSDKDGIKDFDERYAIDIEKARIRYCDEKKIDKKDRREYYRCTIDPLVNDTIQKIFKDLSYNSIEKKYQTSPSLNFNINEEELNEKARKTPVVINLIDNDINIDLYIDYPEKFNYTLNKDDNYYFFNNLMVEFHESTTIEFFGNCNIRINSSPEFQKIDIGKSKSIKKYYKKGDILYFKDCGEDGVEIKVSNTAIFSFYNYYNNHSDVQINDFDNAIDKAINMWNKNNNYGNLYDFYQNLNFSVHMNKKSVEKDKKNIKICFANFKKRNSNGTTSSIGAVDSISDDEYKHIYIYRMNNNKDIFKLSSESFLCYTIAHEFGHILGLKDAYMNAEYNNITIGGKLVDIEPDISKNIEIPSTEIMYKQPNGTTRQINLNDIEMVLLGKCGNYLGINYYVPYINKLSPAIRSPRIYYVDIDDNEYYCDKFKKTIYKSSP